MKTTPRLFPRQFLGNSRKQWLKTVHSPSYSLFPGDSLRKQWEKGPATVSQERAPTGLARLLTHSFGKCYDAEVPAKYT